MELEIVTCKEGYYRYGNECSEQKKKVTCSAEKQEQGCSDCYESDDGDCAGCFCGYELVDGRCERRNNSANTLVVFALVILLMVLF